MKCESCKNTIEQLFLNKLKGTYIKDKKGKKHIICFDCQKKLRTKEDILEALHEA